jgi:hypothetical protein
MVNYLAIHYLLILLVSIKEMEMKDSSFDGSFFMSIFKNEKDF